MYNNNSICQECFPYRQKCGLFIKYSSNPGTYINLYTLLLIKMG